MRGMHQMNRVFFFLFGRGTHKSKRAAQRAGRVQAAEQSPHVLEFWSKLEDIRNGEGNVCTRVDYAGSGNRAHGSGPGVLAQSQGNRAVVGGSDHPADGSDHPASPVIRPGLYFYADGVLHDGIPSYEALEHELSRLDPSAQVSEVQYHD